MRLKTKTFSYNGLRLIEWDDYFGLDSEALSAAATSEITWFSGILEGLKEQIKETQQGASSY